MSSNIEYGGITIAIDGVSGSGKSTIAKEVAKRLGLYALDTGAMYRAVTLLVFENGIDPDDAPAVSALAEQMDLTYSEEEDRWFLGDRDVTKALRSDDVNKIVSLVAANKKVREILVARQREWVKIHHGGVVEGRDITSVVLPDADLKIYLTASDEIRSKRRTEQALSEEVPQSGAVEKVLPTDNDDTFSQSHHGGEMGSVETKEETDETDYPGDRIQGIDNDKELTAEQDFMEELEKQAELLLARDSIDQSREHSPLVITDDAFVIDTGKMAIEETVNCVIERLYSDKK